MNLIALEMLEYDLEMNKPRVIWNRDLLKEARAAYKDAYLDVKVNDLRVHIEYNYYGDYSKIVISCDDPSSEIQTAHKHQAQTIAYHVWGKMRINRLESGVHLTPCAFTMAERWLALRVAISACQQAYQIKP